MRNHRTIIGHVVAGMRLGLIANLPAVPDVANSSISAMRTPCYSLLEGIVILGVIYGSLVWRVCNMRFRLIANLGAVPGQGDERDTSYHALGYHTPGYHTLGYHARGYHCRPLDVHAKLYATLPFA